MQNAIENGVPTERIVEEWIRAWPTNMDNVPSVHRFCGCLRSRMQFDEYDQESSAEAWGDNAPWMLDPGYVHPQARTESTHPP